MPDYGQTIKHGLRKMLGTSSVRDIDAGFAALADDIDARIAIDDQGPIATRPVSTPVNPGIKGRYFYASDTDQLFRDFGTGWKLVVLDSDARFLAPPDGSITAAKIAPQQAWQMLTLQGIRASSGSPVVWGGMQIAYFKDTLGIVRCRGDEIVMGNNPGGGDVLCTFPAGYRPGGTQMLGVLRKDGVTFPVEAMANGDVVVPGTAMSGASPYSFANVRFRAEN